MKDRPLLYACLLCLLLIMLAVKAGGKVLIRELRPSPLEQCSLEGEQIQAVGTVCQVEQKTRVQAVYLKHVSIRCKSASVFEHNLMIYTDPQLSIRIGNKIKVTGEVSFFQEAENLGNFDQKKYYQIRDIHALIWAETVLITDVSVFRLRQSLSEFRSGWQKILVQELGERNGSALAAMMLGEKSGMDPDLKALYQANGIGHILAISGLHLSLIGLGTYRILRRLTGSYGIGGIAGILFLGIYILMIGMTVSAARAVVMFLFRVGADMTGRHYDAPTALGAAAAAVLIWRPLYLYDGGFWMSFGAVLAMILVLPMFRKLPVKGLWASVSVNLFLLPVILYFFFEIPVYSAALNLFVIPLMSALLALGMTGSMVYLIFPEAGSLVIQLSGVILWIYEKSCQCALILPGARWVAGQPEVWKMAVYYGILTLIIWLQRESHKKSERQSRRISWFCIGIGCLGMGILCGHYGEKNTLEITVLSVGQGDCIHIRGPEGKNYLVDGGSSDVNEVGRYRIEPYLKARGVGALDYVMVSHGDEDHVNGIEELMERRKTGVKIRNLVLPAKEVWEERLYSLAGMAWQVGIPVYTMEQGEQLEEGRLRLTCLSPSARGDVVPGNDASMVLALEYEEFDMLLTGDIEEKGEAGLMRILNQYGGSRSWEVLKAAHHGSSSSTSEGFLQTVRPAFTVISAGVGNPYGHPHAETLKRLEDADSRILTTQDGGMICFRIHANRMFLRRMRGG